jgi:hypothetical protein
MKLTDIRHDHTLRRPVQVFTLCPKCAKEVEVDGSKNLAGIYCTIQTCPKCSARIDVWVRISIGKEPPAPVATVTASPGASPETLNALGAMITRAHEQFKTKYYSGGCPAGERQRKRTA